MQVSYSTHGGIVLAVLVVIAFTIIGIALVRRRLNIKELMLSFLLAAAMIFWFVLSIGEYVRTVIDLKFYSLYSYMPFGTVFVGELGIENFTELMRSYLANQLRRLTVSFGFAVVWGLLAPTVCRVKRLKQFLLITAVTVLPLEVMVMLAYMFGVAELTEYYDTGSFVLLIVGAILGYFIQKGISDMRNERRIENDKG